MSGEPDPARRRLERMGVTVETAAADDPSVRWDLVITEQPDRPEMLAVAWDRVRPGGQLVVITDNQRSPLRWLDARTGSPGGPTIGTLRQITTRLADLGAPHTQIFGLLRGSGSSPTVFRTDVPAVSRAVLAGASANSGALRRLAITGLGALAARGRAAAVLPAWMIVATDHHRPIGPATPTGRIGVELNAQGVVVLGTGPDGLEKFYRDPSARTATLESLGLLADVGFTTAPRIIDQPAPDRVRIQWVPGADVDANNLSVNELELWLRRAGVVLGDLQRRTQRDDGTVLVHGDLWLGAMVTDGDRIAAIIDWDDSHWGDPTVDMRTLLAVARDRTDITVQEREGLIAAAYHGHSEAGGPERARSETGREEPIIKHVNLEGATWEAHEGRRPFAVTHSLAGDKRLTQEAIIALADRIPAANVEMNNSDLPTLFPNDDVPVLDRGPGELVERIIELRRWVALSYLESDPEMKALIDECLDPISDIIGDFQGGMTSREGYIFVAPPGATTPAHLDFEHNFLLQIRGTKRVTVGFVDPELEERTLESMTGGGYGRLPALPSETQEFLLEPGDGIYISPRLAHTIDTLGNDLSISFSLVFHTPWLERGARVHAANHDLRRFGLKPGPYGSSALADHAKSGAVKAWRGLKSLTPS
jgi:hypothetical protein